MDMAFFVVIGILLASGAIVLFVLTQKKHRKEQLREELQMKNYSIKLPKGSLEGKDLKQEINLSEQVFVALLALKKPFALEVAVPHVGDEIQFFISVPGGMGDVVGRQIQAIWADAQVVEVSEFNIFNYTGFSSGAFLAQKELYAIPMRTYQETNTDTFLSILGAFARINEIGEGASLQIMVRPASSTRKKQLMKAIQELRKGKKLKDALGGAPLVSLKDVQEIITLGPTSQPQKSQEPKMIDEGVVKSVEQKASKPLLEVNIRAVASAANEIQANSILEGILAGFSQFSSPGKNEFSIRKPKNLQKLFYKYAFREFDSAEMMILNSEELVSAFHFPTAFTNIPKVASVLMKEAPAPSNLPTEGICVGLNRYRGISREVRITRDDRRRHVYEIGQTGTGKTVFLGYLSNQDIENGEGLCIMDPNGDFAVETLARVPKSRAQDVVYFDPSDLRRPFSLNMLEYNTQFPEQKTFAINEIVGILDALYNLKETGGPMFEQYLRYSLLLLMDEGVLTSRNNEHFTLLEIPRVLSDSDFRHDLLSKCTSILAKNFWEKEAEKAGGEASLENIVPYITSKFNGFIANDYMRPIISQPKTTLNFKDIMDNGKILVANLSKGKIGELNARLLGMILVGKLTMTAFARGDTPIDQRRDFYLYMDEFQNFLTPSVTTILSEARKYRLCLTLAHQFIGQLDDKIKSAIFGNVGSYVVFRVGAEDAEFLERQFLPVFKKENIINLPNLNAYAKVIINGQVGDAFNLFIPFPSRGNKDMIPLLQELSGLKYGRPREDVEREVNARMMHL